MLLLLLMKQRLTILVVATKQQQKDGAADANQWFVPSSAVDLDVHGYSREECSALALKSMISILLRKIQDPNVPGGRGLMKWSKSWSLTGGLLPSKTCR